MSAKVTHHSEAAVNGKVPTRRPKDVPPALWSVLTDAQKTKYAASAAQAAAPLATYANVGDVPAEAREAAANIALSIVSAIADSAALQVKDGDATKAQAKRAAVCAQFSLPYVEPAGRAALHMRANAWSRSATLYYTAEADAKRPLAVPC